MADVESDGDCSKEGKSGEMPSCHQYKPTTWACVSKDIEGEVLKPTVKNQIYITTMKSQELLDKGYNPKEIGMIWNGTLCGEREIPIAKKGVNKNGQKYDTVAHGLKVMKAYAEN